MLRPCLHIDLLEAGVDEAGRGCLAGPVCAAAVIFPKGFRNELLNDSKQVDPENRYELRQVIEKSALSFGIAMIDNREIDNVNILNATFLAMHKALDALQVIPQHILVDGNRFLPYRTIPSECIIKGDESFMSIAAASILAKTYRDDFMVKLHEKHPEYNWRQNKGYATREHRKAIMSFGITPYHRKSFRLYEQLSFF